MGQIEKAANDLLEGISTLPIPINEIVKNHGIKLIPYDFKDDISGVMIIENGEPTIGYNANQHRVRNRFTIAHELGHFILHKDKDLFVDKNWKILYRSANGTWNKHESEANEFAACILMPKHLLSKAIDKLDINITTEEQIKLLARQFDVSTVSMSIRLSRLDLLPEGFF